jgi:signal transduction histidine kinase
MKYILLFILSFLFAGNLVKDGSNKEVPPEEMERIWMRFIRGTAASAQTPGMGLGLSLVQAVAQAHGGKAGCSNNLPGSGATFWIKLPR